MLKRPSRTAPTLTFSVTKRASPGSASPSAPARSASVRLRWPINSSTSRPTLPPDCLTTSTRARPVTWVRCSNRNCFRSTSAIRLPRTLATPISHERVEGMLVTGGGDIRISLISSMPLTKWCSPTRKPIARHRPGASICSGTPGSCSRLRRSYAASSAYPPAGCSISKASPVAGAAACVCSAASLRWPCFSWERFLLIRSSLRGQVLADVGDQILLADRLHQHVLGALAEAPHAVGFHVLGGDDHHRDGTGLRIPGEAAGGLEAVHAGEDHVHQDKIRLVLLRGGDARLGGARRSDLVPRPLQRAGKNLHVGGRIVDDEDMCHCV